MSTLIVQLDMEEFCEVADLSAAYVIEIVEHGILEPQGRAPRTGASTTMSCPWPSARRSCAATWTWNGKAWPWPWTCWTKCGNCAPRTRCSNSAWAACWWTEGV